MTCFDSMAARVRLAARGLLVALSCAGCGAAGANDPSGNEPPPQPLGEGSPVAPNVVGQFSLVRGMFSPGMDVPDGPVPTYLFRGVALGDCNNDGLLDVYDPSDGKLYVRQKDGSYAVAEGAVGP